MRRVDPAIPPALVGDPLRLRQILTCCQRHQIHGARHVLLEIREDRRGAGVSAALPDQRHGIGIAADKHLSIFDAFSQADGSTTAGSSAAPAWADHFRQAGQDDGGEIWVESEPGVGSTFAYDLVRDCDRGDSRAAGAQSRGLSVLIVDGPCREPAHSSRTTDAVAHGAETAVANGAAAIAPGLAVRDGRPFSSSCSTPTCRVRMDSPWRRGSPRFQS